MSAQNNSILLAKSVTKKLDHNKEEFVEYVMNSRQLAKCVNYVFNHRYQGCSNKEEMEKNIQMEYRKFICDFYQLLYKNREIVKKQFALEK